jgi:uncharacterized protein YcfJ
MYQIEKKATCKSNFRILTSFLCALLIFAFAAGCAGSKLGKQSFKVNYYPDCYAPIQKIREEAQKLNRNVAAGAVGGAIAGALLGAVLGKGDKGDILIGAAAGAVVGAGLTYLISKEVQEKAQKERFEIYGQSMNEDYKKLDAAIISARQTQSCYVKTYKQIERDYKAGRYSREEMLARLQELRDGTAEAVYILKEYNDAAGESIQTYNEIIKTEQKRTTDRAEPKTIKTVSDGTKRIQVKKQETDKLIAELEATNQALNNSINDVMTANVMSPVYFANYDTPLLDCNVCATNG